MARKTRIATVGSGVCAVAVFAATGSGATGAAPSHGGSTPVVDCKSRGQVFSPRGNLTPPEYRRVSKRIGSVWFTGARQYGDSDHDDFEPTHGESDSVVKTPFLVPAKSHVTISIHAPSAPHADVETALKEAPYVVAGDDLILESCPRNARVSGQKVGPYTPFIGGFRIDGAQCIRLSVTRGAREPEAGRIALGRNTCG